MSGIKIQGIYCKACIKEYKNTPEKNSERYYAAVVVLSEKWTLWGEYFSTAEVAKGEAEDMAEKNGITLDWVDKIVF